MIFSPLITFYTNGKKSYFLHGLDFTTLYFFFAEFSALNYIKIRNKVIIKKKTYTKQKNAETKIN